LIDVPTSIHNFKFSKWVDRSPKHDFGGSMSRDVGKKRR
jgi:hypothetical protein